MKEFDGLAAIVTGGASGIGLATARLLAERGARVAVLDLNVDGVGPEFLALQCDVTDDAEVTAAVAAAERDFGRLDVVINNAGIGAQGTVDANDLDEWRRVLDVNLLGVVRVARASLPALRSSPAASMVITSSMAATVGLPQRALYSATKGALLSLTLAMAADHVHEGIRVNCVAPGTADTPWVQRLLARAGDPVAELAALGARQPIGRLVSAPEVAEAICYLASPRSASTTGTALPVDGGAQSLRLPVGLAT
ncbi:SDR family oxidoreductase [Dactylosporangium sp. AC04546]|uniref:SDR family NAD(P)-dependent oxidoreductase n=1 Tax=Dactylosporangium sp. AC04546 TaxID=2862460 RepID=UPI001EDCA136|nr:SDR family oxidoreductase [Dactylosporangium sp. AC04546]WVK80918.1 SDR family oxidoreductase [Dactylosporangium sp. AC04546]